MAATRSMTCDKNVDIAELLEWVALTELEGSSSEVEKSILLARDLRGNEFAAHSNLVLYRFTGYYIPNIKNCICRYTVETPANQITDMSIRFKTSCPKAQIYFVVKDLTEDVILAQHKAIGTFILPHVRIQGKAVIASAIPPNAPEPEAPERTNEPNDEVIQSIILNVDADPDAEEEEDGQPFLMSSVEPNAVVATAEAPVEPSLNPSQPQTQKYTLSFYVKERTWECGESDWVFIQEEKRKFWKPFMANRIPSQAPRIKEEKVVQEAKSKNIRAGKSRSMAGKALAKPNVIATSKSAEEKDKKPRPKLKKSKTRSESDIHVESSNVSKMLPKTTSSMTETIQKTMGTKRSGKKWKGATESKKLSPSSEGPMKIIEESGEVEEEEFVQDLNYERLNVCVRRGGKHSIDVTDSTQPHWALEILVSKDQALDIQSNRQLLQNYLTQEKTKWELSQAERVHQGLGTLHHRKKAPPGSYFLSNPFAFAKLLTQMDIHMYLNQSEFDLVKYDQDEISDETNASGDRLQAHGSEAGAGKRPPSNPPPTPVSGLKNHTRDQAHSADLFPTSLAGSDFRLSVVRNQPPSILPVDLTVGSASYMEFRKQFVNDEISTTLSSVPITRQTVLEEFGGEAEAEWKEYLNNVKFYEECRGENAYLYTDSVSEVKTESMKSFDKEEKEVEVVGEGDASSGKTTAVSGRPHMPHAHRPHELDRKCTRLFGVSFNDNRKIMTAPPVISQRKIQSEEVLSTASSVSLRLKRKPSLDSHLPKPSTSGLSRK